MRETGLPFDDIRNLIDDLPVFDSDVRDHTRGQLNDAGIAKGDRMGAICEWYSGWSGRSPAVHRGVVTLFAGTHKLDNALTDGAAGDEVLKQVTDISAGNAMLNRLCHQHDLGLKVFDLALQLPVSDISQEPALDERSCAGTIAFGMEAIAGGSDLLCIAAIEPSASSSSLAILAVLHDLDIKILAENFSIPEENLVAAIAQVKGHANNPLEVLRRLGGRETAALCGAILATRSQHIPVILDSIAALAAAAVLKALNSDAISHCLFAQDDNKVSPELIRKIGLDCVMFGPIATDPINAVAVAAGVVKSACLALQGKA